MERAKLLAVTLLGAFSLFMPKMECLPQPNQDRGNPHPLCISQLALVNHACSLLPLTPRPGPTPPAPPPPDHDDGDHDDSDDNGSDGDYGHSRHCGHRHRRRHRHRHREIASPVMEDCCRWLKEVDSECVCDLLIRLPPFLVRPAHVYTVNVEDACSVTYQCGGRITN